MRFAPAALMVACLLPVFGRQAQSAQAQNTFVIDVPKLDASPNMLGSLDASWSKAAQIPVAFDFTYRRSGEESTVYIAQDPQAIDVAFVAYQKEPVTQDQETNAAGVLSDDNVTMYLWPQGTQGFQYAFSANPRGARYQTSSENASYSPQWTAVGRRTPDGYSLTMRIPLNIIRSGHSSTWKAQFARTIVATNSTVVWAHVSGQRQFADPAFAGTLEHISAMQEATAVRPKPRLQLYSLGELTTPVNGGSTSRVGADVALPVTATSSLLGTFHPDYSNVETDQQTIAPTAYARMYTEVRPFFTQATSNFNFNFSCTNCPLMLYTPSIPQFGLGYAYEGTGGPWTFGAFNAAGTGRSDSGEALNYNVSDPGEAYGINVQRIAVNTPLLHDTTGSVESGWLDQHSHVFVYFNGAQDRGTNVSDPGLGDYFEYGGGYVSQLTTAGFTFQKIGAQFDPADGYVAQTDIAGYNLFYKHTLNFSPAALLHDVSLNAFYGRFHDRFGNTAQTNGDLQLNIDFHNLMTLHVFTNSNGVQTTYSKELLPYNSNGFEVGYKTQTTTPTSITYNGGLYDHGHLTAWSYLTTQPLRHGLNLGLETDESFYAPGPTSLEPQAKQWLERVSLDWQLNRLASFDIGLRRIIGRNLPDSFQAPDFSSTRPCGTTNGLEPFDCVEAGNVSLAFHYLASRNEFYVVYGNPNNLATLPALYLKWIRYFGAEKGT